MKLLHSFISVTFVVMCSLALHAEEQVFPESALRWQPKEYPEADLHPRIAFLKPERQWERIDVWVPKEPADGKLPCVVAVFGGGYGDKVGGFINDARPLLERGFVVAAPDYALQTDAPVPLCAWDVAAAIRYLRRHADEYRIDPERIGVWGWSAGGWIAQDLCYAGPERMVYAPAKVGNQQVARWFPMIEPHPQFPEESVSVQAVVTDWGAEKLWDKRTKAPRPWLTADDPPLFTCYNEEYREDLVNPVMLLRKLGTPSRGVYRIVGNTHVPNLKTTAVSEDGSKTTWGEAIYDFLEDRLKHIDTATAPEMIPHGGETPDQRKCGLLSVHPAGAIHYTLDGSQPDASSQRYDKPVSVQPGQTLRAIAVREGLKSSPMTAGTFVAGPPQPTIKTAERSYEAQVDKPFRVEFQADGGDGVLWSVGGKTGEQYREFGGQRFNPPRHVPWMQMDAETGVLSGVPRSAGVYPVIVSCLSKPTSVKDSPTGDAMLVVVHVKE